MAARQDRNRKWRSIRCFRVKATPTTRKSLVVLISGSGTNLQAIIDAVGDGRINARIAAVISNREDAAGLERAHAAGIATHFIDPGRFNDRDAYDRQLIDCIDSLAPDLIVLAGFMRILSEAFITHYADRILNIHPSLLPALKGLHTHQRALDAGLDRHGASVHFVSNELDSGPVVIQAQVPVLATDTETSLAARVLEREHEIYPLAIGWFVDGRLEYAGSKVLLDRNPLSEPVLWKPHN
jgi:phosphoribosylglycinamide formyltransferase-1